MLRTKWGIVAALVLAAGSVSAQAQRRTDKQLPAVDISRLDLNPGARDSLLVHTGRLSDPGALRIGLAGHYMNRPSYTRRGEGMANVFLTDRVTAVGSVGYTVNEWVEVYGNIPFVMHQREDRSLSSIGFREIDSTGIGQPLVGARVGLLKQQTMPLNLALGFAATLPIGTDEALAGEPRIRMQPSISFGREIGDLVIGGQVGVRFRNQENFAYKGLGPVTQIGDTVTHELGLQATVGYRVMEKLRLNLDIVGDRSLKIGRSGGGTIQPFLGARYELSRGMEAFASVGYAFGTLSGTPDFQGLAGIAFTPGGQTSTTTTIIEEIEKTEDGRKAVDPLTQDDDKDGIPNRADACPKQAEDKDGHQDSDGCPDEDNDGDRVPDTKDACPDQKGQPENAGCPPKDGDKDGVADVADRCPTEQGDVAEGGCPVRDSDKDGVRDELDFCPNEAGDKERRGCPVKDTDKDGVSDELDNCVREKGVKENAGCPARQRQLVTITREKLVISDKIYFTPGKSTIMPKSRVLLSQVAKILKEHPEIPKVRVEGHTDNVGIPEKNKKLSDDRAKAVMDFLVKAGVKAEKLEAQGFGQEKPIADNNTAQGRETNRRVEFFIVDAPPTTETRIEPEPLR